MSAEFYRYLRWQSDEIPAGHSDAGMRAYRHLVYLGVSQMIEAHYPEMREQMGEEDWKALMIAFIRQSAWTSPYYGDLHEEFLAFIARETA